MPNGRISKQLHEAARELSTLVDALKFGPPVTHVYNPLHYAWNAHAEYIRRFGDNKKRVLFMGMNPGPFGMVQTGVPFGEIKAVRDWMGIHALIEKPAREHAKRPILGFECERSEVSGLRLWKLFADRFGPADAFFKEHFVVNYCPLAFCEESGCNRTPDKLPARETDPLMAACDAHLRRVLEILQPEWLIGVGGFAAERAALVSEGMKLKLGQILHPSPASPLANRDWAGTASSQLQKLGVWS
jgi:single-strand selective monofunctional uracil DNA glycosylase